MVKLIQDGQVLASARYKSSGTEIQTYDDGFGPLWISRCSMGINGIVRTQTWEDAYGICEDEFFPEADETVDQLIAEYGKKREHVKVIHPAVLMPLGTYSVDMTVERDATQVDYELFGGRLLDGQFIRWETRETPAPDAWVENELFCEAFGFRNNGPNDRDTLKHGIYQKDLNEDYLDRLTAEMLADWGIDLTITSEEEDSEEMSA